VHIALQSAAKTKSLGSVIPKYYKKLASPFNNACDKVILM